MLLRIGENVIDLSEVSGFYIKTAQYLTGTSYQTFAIMKSGQDCPVITNVAYIVDDVAKFYEAHNKVVKSFIDFKNGASNVK